MMMKNFRIGDWISKKMSKPGAAGERGQSADESTEMARNGQEKRKGAPTKG